MINQPGTAEQPILTNQEKMVKGSAWMTASNIISRLLGAVYIIPWYAWMGEHADEANSLFSMGYTVYSLFLLISTAGIPAAIAKQTAHYNSMNEYKISRQLFYKALQMMAVLGAVFALVMYISAPALASWSGGGEELVPTMKSLSLAVLVFPCMSVIRGYFQGNQDMMPFALSQIVEQVARVFYMLLTAFIIMKVFNGDYVDAVTQSTFAAFIGMIVSFVVLYFYLHKQKPMFDYLEAHSANKHQVSPQGLLIETFKEAIPFIIVGSGVTVFKLVDQFTFSNFMRTFTSYSDSQLRELFGVFNANPDKLTMVVIALATSIAMAGLPLITEAVTQKKYRDLSKLISNNLQLFAFVMLPSTFGMIVLARPLYTLFYRPDGLGTSLLIQACYAGLFMGLYMLISNMLMGMYGNRAAIRYFAIGLAVKLIVQYPSIRFLEAYGPLVATMIGFSVSCFLLMRKIKEISKFNLSLTLRRSLLIFVITLIMIVFAFLTKQFLYLFLNPDRKGQAFLIVLIVAAVGIAVYGYMTLKIRLADRLLGKDVDGLRAKVKIK
ncbi:polysaccharide biosynthesis protein [Enterococcus sp. BWB1-3]|uniref:putative polysaccharide biosynthesis protein n=1 Tax=unclassified Enterococcus TaxID=2608891 RepID=UPI00192516BF|nr:MULTISPECIES: polysaccharide biosynthesis protein [unclassified Enterococcus]MBL1228681.1 polysaccharide biosynthesis protein [Enterococcus sp. BWB1-3]MCB5952752.1 polysaccharide biosynthesis protein [Enterococcus sp. BWT-B8]MCB5953678.1 polysaccharide biosynthesis protein [Enterococcus sp. CWB-B31]